MKTLDGGRYVIWSGQHRAWWRARASGYTGDLLAAGVYTKEEAQRCTRGLGEEKQIKVLALAEAWQRWWFANPREGTVAEIVGLSSGIEGGRGYPPAVRELMLAVDKVCWHLNEIEELAFLDADLATFRCSDADIQEILGRTRRALEQLQGKDG